MSRRSTPQKKLDQNRFAVFVRIKIPEKGFGVQINEIHEWLRSGWPTFPMVFVDTVLVGGSKDVRALIAEGRLNK